MSVELSGGTMAMSVELDQAAAKEKYEQPTGKGKEDGVDKKMSGVGLVDRCRTWTASDDAGRAHFVRQGSA